MIRMFTITIIVVMMATNMVMTACDVADRCEKSLYDDANDIPCPEGWYPCCSTGNYEDCEEGGTGEGHWTCCNNEECNQEQAS
jgi:hypothetical protein